MTSAREQAIEQMARAIFASDVLDSGSDASWGSETDATRDEYQANAAAALDALLQARSEEPCPVCWGRVNDVAPGAKCKNPDCNGGKVSGPLLLLELAGGEQVGWRAQAGFYENIDRIPEASCIEFGWDRVYRFPATQSPKGAE